MKASNKLFPLTFKGNSTISNPAETVRHIRSASNITMMRVTSSLAQSLQ